MQIAKRGKAALTICSSVFLGLGKMQSKALGVPQLPIVTIEHPFGVRTRDEVRALADRCAEDVAKVLGGGGAR